MCIINGNGKYRVRKRGLDVEENEDMRALTNKRRKMGLDEAIKSKENKSYMIIINENGR